MKRVISIQVAGAFLMGMFLQNIFEFMWDESSKSFFFFFFFFFLPMLFGGFVLEIIQLFSWSWLL